ncbi:hypothetical protein HGA88_03980 [Candidatus Roizmanbacteria bacterium]|nr:hypothetical protein [Candidatus Roizmanbacteria bacterium]
MTESEATPINPQETTKKDTEYPFEYFDAQVRFAQKWSELSGEPISQSLLSKTALYRRLTNVKPTATGDHPLWEEAMHVIDSSASTEQISQALYSRYLAQEHSVYAPSSYPENDGKHFGFFSFDHYPPNPQTGERDRIKVHFINKSRGEKSGLDPMCLEQRQGDLRRMFQYVHEHCPEAQDVIGGSWLYALQSYRDSFPQEFVSPQNMKRLVPKGFEHIPNSVPLMSFDGNSVWGQFVSRTGGVREHVYREFTQNIEKSTNLEQLVEAFPNKPYQPKVPIEVFYKWSNVPTQNNQIS